MSHLGVLTAGINFNNIKTKQSKNLAVGKKQSPSITQIRNKIYTLAERNIK